jgi:hypothetical protein
MQAECRVGPINESGPWSDVMKDRRAVSATVKQNPKTDVAAESQVSKSARPFGRLRAGSWGLPQIFLCECLRTTRVILGPKMLATSDVYGISSKATPWEADPPAMVVP